MGEKKVPQNQSPHDVTVLALNVKQQKNSLPAKSPIFETNPLSPVSPSHSGCLLLFPFILPQTCRRTELCEARGGGEWLHVCLLTLK